jgi:LacI family transcriptional regulator
MSSKNRKKAKKITIKEIAEKANVSFSTVAKALNNDPLIAKKTKERIIKIAENLNYYPNMLAASLRMKKTKSIGIILNDLTNPLYYETIKIIETNLSKRGYTIILSDSNYNLEIEKKNIITMMAKQVDGVIISPINSASENIDLILKNDLKAVFIDVIPQRKSISYVCINHNTAAIKSTNFLIDKGHKKILLLLGPVNLSSSETFLRGHLETLTLNNIKKDKSLIIYSELSINGGYEIMLKIYNNQEYKDKFSAILCISDLLAMGVYKASIELNFKIPEKFSIIGYDNIFVAPYLNPPLTTIHAQKTKVGIYSTEILLEKIEKYIKDNKKIDFEPYIIERKSVCKIKKSNKKNHYKIRKLK